MTIEPLNDNVLVTPVQLDKKTEAGLLLPESKDEESPVAEVVSVGPQFPDDRVQPGTKVVYEKYAGQKFGRYMLLKSTDIGGVIKD